MVLRIWKQKSRHVKHSDIFWIHFWHPRMLNTLDNIQQIEWPITRAYTYTHTNFKTTSVVDKQKNVLEIGLILGSIFTYIH